MTLPNDASVGLHRAMGFEHVGTYRRIGFKHGSWHDVAWTQRILAAGEEPARRAQIARPSPVAPVHGDRRRLRRRWPALPAPPP